MVPGATSNYEYEPLFIDFVCLYVSAYHNDTISEAGKHLPKKSAVTRSNRSGCNKQTGWLFGTYAYVRCW
jgi:hypothetical protein